jgi:hypothetical protein
LNDERARRTKVTVLSTISRRELAHRTSNGLEIFLFWNQPGNGITVEVFDAPSGEGFEFPVDSSHALDAFHHPYAYAAAQGVRTQTVGPDALAA